MHQRHAYPRFHDCHSVANGMSFDEIFDEYHRLKKESVQAALAYAANIVREEAILPLAG